MSPLDMTLLCCALLTVPLAWLPSRIADVRWVRASLLCVAALCILQLLLEGFYWQFVPAYALLGIGAITQIGISRESRLRRIVLAVIAGIAVLTLAACWIALPVPRLPMPTGPYAVGSMVFRWEQPNRDEPATTSPNDRRNIIVQAWYPAGANAIGTRMPYLDGLGRLPSSVAGLPHQVFAHYDRIETHAVVGAAVSAESARWPVIIFSPGYGASRAFYTSLLSDLASRGVIVLALDHPYEAAITQLADGRIVTAVERFLPGDRDRVALMIRQSAQRVADVRAVMDAVTTDTSLGSLTGRMDATRMAVVGHSFGGAAAIATAQVDERVRAAVNIDGTLYGDVPDSPIRQPFLLVQSDRRETKHGAPFLNGHARLFAHSGAHGQRHEFARTNHYSFTDAPLLLSAPWRWIVSRVAGGSLGTATTVRVTNDLLMTFLATSWSGPTVQRVP